MKINIFQSPDGDKGTVVKMLQTINNGDEIVIEYSRNNGLQFSSETILLQYLPTLITIVLSIPSFLWHCIKFKATTKKYPVTKFDGINFISTDAKGTPFFFFSIQFLEQRN